MDVWQGYIIAFLVGMVMMAIAVFALQQPRYYRERPVARGMGIALKRTPALGCNQGEHSILSQGVGWGVATLCCMRRRTSSTASWRVYGLGRAA
jgi:hypothetical protein